MFSTAAARPRALAIALFIFFGLLLVPQARAETETFHRFEVLASARYVVNVACPNGSIVRQQVQVLAGYEEQTEFGETESDEFLTVLYAGRDCEGNFFNDFGTGAADFTFSPSLQTASVNGTITTDDGRTVTVDMSWEGTGPIESTSNTTTFPGFVGHFQGKRRDAVATGTVVVDGQTIVNGSTSNAELETLEDTNRTTGASD
jgi:hypothetical protein